MVYFFIWAILGVSPFLILISRSFLLFWVFLEMVSIMFIYTIQPDEEMVRKELSLIYFLSQSVASALFLLASFGLRFLTKVSILDSPGIFSSLICICLCFKVATAPFHQWIVKIGKSLVWKVLLILLSWQKLTPICILIKIPLGGLLSLLAFLSLSIGVISQMKIASTKIIFIFSSISHLGWLLFPTLFYRVLPVAYILLYSTILISILKKMEISMIRGLQSQVSFQSVKEFTLILLSLAGIPPLLGFVLKWVSLKFILIRIMLSFLFTIGACLSFYIYIRIGLKSMLSQGPELSVQMDRKGVPIIWIINLSLPLFIFIL